MIRTRQHRNSISKLIGPDGQECGSQEAIQEEAIRYFSKLYNQNNYTNIFPEFVGKRIVTQAGNAYLLAPITAEEVDAIVMSADPDKLPGPNRFGSRFYKLH